MATINKKKNIASHPRFAKRCKDSQIKKIIDVTDVQEFLREDWEEIVELNPEYLQPKILFEKLINERPISELRKNIEMKTPKHRYFNEEIRERERNRIMRERICKNYRRMELRREREMLFTIDQLKIKKRLLVDEKESLLEEIEFFKANLEEEYLVQVNNIN